MIQKLYFFSLLFLLAQAASAQTATIRGTVTEAENNALVVDASVVLAQTGIFAATDNRGKFSLYDVPPGAYTVVVTRNGFLPIEQKAEVKAGEELVLNLSLSRDPASVTTNSGDIPTITLEEGDSDDEGSSDVGGLLNASRDVFQNVSNFGWFVFRFRERGYDGDNFPLLLNGVPINDPETGNAFFGEFGGLNDVLRNRESVIGINPADYAFTELGGATNIDTRANVQRKQIRASYAISNRSYRHRVMVTANTGLMPGGWAVSISGSRRWAEEGWYDGTFFDGYSYFLSVDKKFGDKHTLNLTFLGSPSIRGRNGDTFEEMFDLAGNTRYNPNWGYWNDKKRNGYVTHSHQPIALLRYDWKPRQGTNVMLAAYGQAGQYGSSRLDWFNGVSPEPDYNRRLPSALENPELSAAWADELRRNESLRQIDWAALWEANTINTETIQDANGVAGNSVTGKRSQYVIADFRGDTKEAGFNALLRQALSERFTLNGGANYQWYLGKNFKTADDLLGGDFIVDWDKYAQQDVPNDPLARNNDLQIPNHVVREGEKYGFDYDENIRKGGIWLQVRGDLRRFSVFGGAENQVTQFWRTGNMQNGRFPESSLGDSRKQTFNTYNLKAGLTYKLSGRHFLYVNGLYGTRAPQFRDLYLSPRIRNQALENPDPSKINSVEGGYQWRAPRYRARLTGYFTQFKGENDNYLVYVPSQGVFGSILQTGVDHQHTGIEAAIEAKPIVGWTFSAAANLGRYIYTSRPKLYLTLDNTAETVLNGVTVYQKNFYVARTPQTTASLGVKYESRQFWFASLSANYADNFWYQFDPTRRTAGFVEPFERGTPLWHLIIDQQKAPAAFTLDFFGGKSWRIKRDYFIYLNVGVNNILNNLNIVTSGRDAYRNAYRNDLTDVRLYSSQLTYAQGTNYFVSLAFRM